MKKKIGNPMAITPIVNSKALVENIFISAQLFVAIRHMATW
jgi:hypothetical protein